MAVSMQNDDDVGTIYAIQISEQKVEEIQSGKQIEIQDLTTI